MPNWQADRPGPSARPILERIDATVQHIVANGGDVSKIPDHDYNLLDLYLDFCNNPGGVMEVGGHSRVEDYPVVEPRGKYVLPPEEQLEGKITLIGHSAGGWISRAYLSNCSSGGKIYGGSKCVHSLVTLGTPHGNAPGPLLAALHGVIKGPHQCCL